MSKWIEYALAFGCTSAQQGLDLQLFELLLEERRRAREAAMKKLNVEASNDEEVPAEDGRKAA
ncbi:MAG: hypothetical protein KDI36_09120 [Pseudomonadales bacterium]|nr:hypothetical protein [Pseudomonadales bacterium]